MSVQENVNEFVDRLINIENELKMLQQDRKALFDEYKDRLDVKAIKAAVQIAKIRCRLGDSEAELDNIFDSVSAKISL